MNSPAMSSYEPPADVTQQTAAFLRKLDSLALPPIAGLAVEDAREQMERGVAAREQANPAIRTSIEMRIPGPAGLLPARLYMPEGEGTPGLLVYFHGGGHVIGNLFTHDATARSLCHHGACAVLSVEYRKAPEHVFPAAVDDCYAALLWAAGNLGRQGIDTGRIAVGGDSAGGNLAAVVAIMARDEDGPAIRLQLLIYPLVDYRCQGDSYRRFGTGYGILEAETMHWFRNHYLGSDQVRHEDWRASPLLAPSLAGLPPAQVIAAGCDVLRDEARAYAARLIGAGVTVEFLEYPGVLHAFFGLTGLIDEADAAHGMAGRALRTALAGQGGSGNT